MRRTAWLLGGLAALTILASGPEGARASGLDGPTIGSVLSGPAIRDPAALYWNPAQLGFFDRADLMVGAAFVAGRVGYTRERRAAYQHEDGFEFAEPVRDLDPSKTGTADEASAVPIAGSADAFFVWPVIPRRASVGVGLYVPYAAPLKFPADGAQRFALQEVFLSVTRIAAGVGVRVHDAVSIGGSVSYELGVASIKRVQDFAAVDDFGDALGRPPIDQPNDFGLDAPPSVRELQVLARPFSLTDATSHGVTFNVGVAIEPTRHTSVGLTYDHGSEADFRGDFALDLSDDFFTRDLAQNGLHYAPLVQGDGRLRINLPRRVNAGVLHALSDRWTLGLDVAWVQWSSLDAFRITLESPDLAQPELGLPSTSDVALPRNWQDAVHAQVHVRDQVRPSLWWGAGLGYQSPASPDQTIDAASPDGHRLVFTGALGWDATDSVSVLGDARLQVLLPRSVEDSDYDLGNGTYNLFIALVGAHLRLRFGGGDEE